MKVLVVGAGAVGQVYGHHLRQGGAEVTYFVREKYAAAARAGFVLFPLNGTRTPTPLRSRDHAVVSSVADVAATAWDHVLLTVSSAALRGEWLGGLLAAAPAATVVMLQPGADDRALVAPHVPDERLVSSMITLVSYAAPLPGETRFPEPGMAYWFPPLAPSPFSGPAARPFVAALRRGGLPAKVVADVPRKVELPSALLMPWLAALEHAGWTFAGLFGSPWGRAGSDGAREALAIAARRAGRRAGPMAMGARAWVFRSILWGARRLVPFPLETYLREHFIKVGDQTRLFMDRYIELGRQAGQPTAALERLRRPPDPA